MLRFKFIIKRNTFAFYFLVSFVPFSCNKYNSIFSAFSIALLIAISLSSIMLKFSDVIPDRIISIIWIGSSLLGLSEVMITLSLSDEAIRPISARFVWSRSPPQPNTVYTGREPLESFRIVWSAFNKLSGVWE